MSDAQRSTRQGPILIHPTFDRPPARFASWTSEEPRNLAILIDTRITIFGGTENSAVFLAGTLKQPLPGTVTGRLTARYGYGAFGSTLTWDLRPGTFCLPACDSCDLTFQAVRTTGESHQDPNGISVGSLSAALVPIDSGLVSDPFTHTYRIPVYQDEKSETQRLEAVLIPPRAVSYYAWITGSDFDQNEAAAALVTNGPGGRREWYQDAPAGPAQLIGPNFGEVIDSRARNLSPDQKYEAFIQFRLAP